MLSKEDEYEKRLEKPITEEQKKELFGKLFENGYADPTDDIVEIPLSFYKSLLGIALVLSFKGVIVTHVYNDNTKNCGFILMEPATLDDSGFTHVKESYEKKSKNDKGYTPAFEIGEHKLLAVALPRKEDNDDEREDDKQAQA